MMQTRFNKVMTQRLWQKCLALLCLLWTSLASSQGNPESESLRSALHSSAISMSNRAQQMLAEHIPDGQAFVWVDIDWNLAAIRAAIGSSLDEGGSASEVGIALPYELRTSTWSLKQLNEVVISNAQPYIQRLSVTLYLDTDLPQDAENISKRILTHSLPFKESRGDTINVERQNMGRFDLKKQIQATTEKIAELQRSSDELQQAINQERLEKESYSNQIQSLENAETTLKGQLEEQSRLLKDAESELTALKNELQELNSLPEFLQTLRKYSQGFELPLAALICVVILCMAGFFWLLVDSVFKRRMSEKIAGSIGLVAESMKQSSQAAGKPAQSVSKEEKSGSGSKKRDDDPASSQATFPTLPPEQVQMLNGQAKVLWKELISWKFPTIVVLKEWLAQEDTVRVAKVLTALDPEDQSQFIASFSTPEANQVIQSLVRSPLPGEAATISSQLYQEVQVYLQGRPAWTTHMANPSFMRVELESLARVLAQQDADLVAFVLYLILPKCASRLIELTPESLCERALQLMPGIASISEDDAARRLEVINAAIESVALSERSAVAAQSIALYESVRENLRNAITSGLSEQADILNYVMQNVISIDKVFSVDQDTLSEILEPFSPEELAILLTGLRPEYVDLVRPTMSRTAFITMQGEMSRITSRPSMMRKASINSLRLQKELLRRVKNMQRDGSLSFDENAIAEGESYPTMGQVA